MNLDTRDISESIDLSDGFVIYQNDKGFFIALRVRECGIVACQQIDKTAYDCIARRERVHKT